MGGEEEGSGLPLDNSITMKLKRYHSTENFKIFGRTSCFCSGISCNEIYSVEIDFHYIFSAAKRPKIFSLKQFPLNFSLSSNVIVFLSFSHCLWL